MKPWADDVISPDSGMESESFITEETKGTGHVRNHKFQGFSMRVDLVAAGARAAGGWRDAPPLWRDENEPEQLPLPRPLPHGGPSTLPCFSISPRA